jgi:hypothetical protein
MTTMDQFIINHYATPGPNDRLQKHAEGAAVSNDIHELLQSSIAEAILAELKRLNTQSVNDTTLWDADDVAAFLRVTKKHLQNHKILTRPDFPAAFLLPLTDERPAKRWRARDVMSWATRIRATNNNRRIA